MTRHKFKEAVGCCILIPAGFVPFSVLLALVAMLVGLVIISWR